MKLSFNHAILLQDYENLLLTARAVFGKGDGAGKGAGDTIIAETGDEIMAALHTLGLT